MKEKEKFNVILVSIAAVILLVVGVTFIALTNHINENDNLENNEIMRITPQDF